MSLARDLAGLAVALCLWLFAGALPAAATCGSASCFLVTGTTDGPPSRGTLLVDLSFRYVDQSRKLAGTEEVGEVLTPRIDFENEVIEPDHHREISTLDTRLQVDLAYGITDRWGVTATLPLVNDREHEHFDDVGPGEFFTNDDGTSGFGDVRVGARYVFIVAAKNLLVGGLEAKLPTGSYRLLDSEGEINEPTIQPGTGSTDAIASLLYEHLWTPRGLDAFVSGATRFNTENSLGYRLGDEVQLNAGVRYRHGGRAAWSLQLNGRRTRRDEYLGESVPSTGSLLVNVTPGVTFDAASGTSLFAHVQVPVYQDVNEAQLAPRFGFVVGLSKSFGAAP
jgi:hypothetical protein